MLKIQRDTHGKYGYMLEQKAARENQDCGQEDQGSKKRLMEKVKAPVLWTIKWEEVDKNG